MSKITRDLVIPYIDLSGGATASEGTYQWERVRKSTIFEFSMNAQEDTFGYIDTKNDTTEVTSYQPQLPLETVPESSDKVYAFFQDYMFRFPLGSDTQVPFMLVYPIIDKSTGEIDQTNANAIIWDEAVLSNPTLNTVDQLATWTEMLNGTPKYGTVAIGSTDFTPNDGNVPPSPVTPEPGEETGGDDNGGEETASTFSTRAKSSSK